MKVFSSSKRTFSSDSRRTFSTIGSRSPYSLAPPPRLSSQFADQVTAVSFPVISDLGRATGKSSPSGGVHQTLIVIRPRLVVVAQFRLDRAGEDAQQFGQPAADLGRSFPPRLVSSQPPRQRS